LQFQRIKGLFQEKNACRIDEDSFHIVANVCSWADPIGSYVLLSKVYGHRRKKRSRLVPFLGDLGWRLLICRDPSFSGKIRGKKAEQTCNLGKFFCFLLYPQNLKTKLVHPMEVYICL
jgi:hypothetical protein